MRDPLPPTSYVSRVLPLPGDVARQVFDACRVDRQYRSADHDRWAVPAGTRFLLEVRGPGHVPDGFALRSCPGKLHLGLVGSCAVELELNPWSRTQSEVALRLVGRRRPSSRYLDGAAAVVDALAAELEMRGLLALHPSHLTGATGSAPMEVAASAWL